MVASPPLRGGVRKFTTLFVGLLFLQLCGCGYSHKTLLPSDVKSVHVAPVKNTIDLSGEIGDNKRFRVTRPGVEVDLTNAIINRFIIDGTLKVAGPEAADAILEAKLMDYRRDALRYSDGDDIQEYRLSVTLETVLYRAKDRKVLLRQGVTGDTTFFLSGALAVSEDEAVVKAVEDAARRVVEKTIELW